jgi:uncharacterized PurR-regulated membrane protein YhhQ (DUF165 family)
MTRAALGWAALTGLVASVIIANWLVANVDPIPVGLGLKAPAGVLMIGLALALRDVAHTALGRSPVLAAIIVGALLSFTVSPAAVALASATAYLFSELADLAVYEPLRRRGLTLAVFTSNLVGLTIDSIVFLVIIHAIGYLPGQILGKLEMTIAVSAAVYVTTHRRALLPRHA